ncbi:MAG: c-type cytochrome [Chloroflexota bacterium]
MSKRLVRLFLVSVLLPPLVISGMALAHDKTEGQKAFDSKCASCHGPAGSGGVGPALNTPGYEADEIRTAIRQGRGGMPAFPVTAISDAELDEVVAYIQSLAVPPAAPPLPAGAPRGKEPIRVEVSRNGFNNTPGEFRLEAEEGQEVEITFVYGERDLTQNNPHQILVTGYNIDTGILDQENREVTVRFTATGAGEVSFMCILPCLGHSNLLGGRIVIQPTAKPAAEAAGVTRRLDAPAQARSGRPLSLRALVEDGQGKPVGGTPVKFFIKVDFFVNGLMEIGEAMTNDHGVAVLEYTPRLTGDIRVVARHEGGGRKATETATTINLAESSRPFYQPEVGIKLPAPGPEIFVGLGSTLEATGSAPMTSLRLPGGLLSWLLLLVGGVVLVWVTYFRVMYQLLRISEGTETRLVPLVGMAVVVVLGTLLVLVVITGPSTHLHVHP